MHAVPKGELLNSNKTQVLTAFSLYLSVGETFGLIEKSRGWASYRLDPQSPIHLPSYDLHGQNPPHRSFQSIGQVLEWRAFAGTQRTDLTRDVSDIMFQVNNKRLHLSKMVEWQLYNLKASFEKLVGTSKRTVMVYSDVVESSVVGSGKFPLLDEVQLLRAGEGRGMVEPLHQQWIKVRGNQLDIVEVEIATPDGPLGILPPWENHRDHWTQTAIKTTTYPWVENTQTEQRCEEGV